MKKRYGFICLIILLLLIGILGPRVNTMISLDTISLPSDLDLYLIASESEFDDITAVSYTHLTLPTKRIV